MGDGQDMRWCTVTKTQRIYWNLTANLNFISSALKRIPLSNSALNIAIALSVCFLYYQHVWFPISVLLTLFISRSPNYRSAENYVSGRSEARPTSLLNISDFGTSEEDKVDELSENEAVKNCLRQLIKNTS